MKLPDGRIGVVTPPELVVPVLPEWEVVVRLASLDGVDGVHVSQEIRAEFRELEVFDSVDTPRKQRCMKLQEYLQEEMQIQTVIREAKEIQCRSGGMSGADFLHHRISADRWGITAASLRNFESTVRKKWSEGQMKNTGKVEYSRAKFHNGNIGPNMYQVNDQVIKPMTADPSLILPGVSWALSDCLAGHAVTHFVSHAWAEGLFEFCRLLFEKWLETEGTSAYICFLSNPQNLDIKSFLARVETSPFYVALQNMPSSGQMIMVATANIPIHSRLWCVCEAFIAMERDIPILLSGSPANLGSNPFWVLWLRDAISTFHHFASGKCGEKSGPEIDEETPELAEEEEETPELAEEEPCAVICCTLICMWLCWSIVSVPFLWVFFSVITEGWPAWLEHVPLNVWLKRVALALGLLYIGGTFLLGCLSCFMCAKKCFQQAAVSGQFINVRKAECGDKEDAKRIREYIAGQEDRINSMLAPYFLTLSLSHSDQV